QSEYPNLLSTERSCRTPGGNVLTDVVVRRGKTITSSTRSHLARADKKSQLYCAIPPCPPNASVTSARTRTPDRLTKLLLWRPIPGNPTALPRHTDRQQAQELAASPGCDCPAAATIGSGL